MLLSGETESDVRRPDVSYWTTATATDR